MKINRLFPLFLIAAIGTLLVYAYPCVIKFLHTHNLAHISKSTTSNATPYGVIGYIMILLPMLLTWPTVKREFQAEKAMKYIIMACVIGVVLLFCSESILKKTVSRRETQVVIYLSIYFLMYALPLIFSATFLSRMNLTGKSWAIAGYYIAFFIGLSLVLISGVTALAHGYKPITGHTLILINKLSASANLLAAFFIVLGWFLTAKGARDYDREFLSDNPIISGLPSLSSKQNLQKMYGSQTDNSSGYSFSNPYATLPTTNPAELNDTLLEQILVSADPKYSNDYKDAVSEVLLSRQSPVIFSKLNNMTNNQLREIIANSADYFSGYVKAAQSILDYRK